MLHGLTFHPWLETLVPDLRKRFESEQRDGAHDLAHALRVAAQAERLGTAEGADVQTCVAAALLHDLVYFPKNHPESAQTAALSAREASTWCRIHPALMDRSSLICEAIRTHSFSSALVPVSPEGCVLQDADRLEALGAIGIARCFATGGAMGAGMWHPDDPWGRTRNLDDKTWSLDHFARKLLSLEGTMRTEAGRQMARQRTTVIRQFLADLGMELEEACPW